MKTKTFICYFTIAVFFMTFVIPMNSNALNYNIAFTGTGASTVVESVIVQNLTKGTTVIVPTGNTLNLYDVVSDVEKLNPNIEHIRIYPNPIKNQSTLSFYAPYAGNCQINILGIDGRNLTAFSSNMATGENEGVNEGVKLNIEGVNEGVKEELSLFYHQIAKHPGKKAIELNEQINKSIATTESYLKLLKEHGLIALKTGGYFLIQ